MLLRKLAFISNLPSKSKKTKTEGKENKKQCSNELYFFIKYIYD